MLYGKYDGYINWYNHAGSLFTASLPIKSLGKQIQKSKQLTIWISFSEFRSDIVTRKTFITQKYEQ